MTIAHVWCDHVDWGDVPTWLAAIGTIVAVWFAVIQYRRLISSRIEEQASRVVAYAASSSFDWQNPRQSTCNAVVLNGSDLPIYECSLRLLSWDWRERKAEPLDGALYPVVLPGTTPEETLDDGLVPPPLSPTTKATISPPLEIEFTDSAGQRWIRRPDGGLERR